ncbi:ABC transporter substrate-binding protein [Marivirga sp. S37H4]|uniref:ABC transporter substrate-binding protein n=2 Tax=Marivirga aurantiaca TaxID=2802615 RepID=A0A934WYF1_9BACT|nr:helical backbone metal receptor [Marivirga aurantiaca]MBK6265202.1 ABC transporter substrate-binding protein [Marivirga aurantiaca]
MPLIDQIGNVINLDSPATRIISLVPSQTELLYELGLDEQVVGITKFCVHPQEWRKRKTIVGGTKNHHIDKIKALKPDLIIANKEENTKTIIEKLYKLCPVYVSDIADLPGSFQMMMDVGALTDKKEEAEKIVGKIQASFDGLEKMEKPFRVAYCIWKDPWMWVGYDTFIDHLLQKCGFVNVVDKARYPSITIEEIRNLQPDLLLLSSEPYPFKEKHIKSIMEKLPETTISLVDGEMFSWYGSRLMKAAPYFQSFLRELHSHTF